MKNVRLLPLDPMLNRFFHIDVAKARQLDTATPDRDAFADGTCGRKPTSSNNAEQRE